MTADHSSESERRTRKGRVDPRLKQWGWEITPFNPAKPLSGYRRHAIEEFPTANGPADYALIVDGKLLGVVEAKKVTLGPQNVLTQAERYSKGVDHLADMTLALLSLESTKVVDKPSSPEPSSPEPWRSPNW
jgi:type I site-specific restriction endonuclease